jgi:hypothetical protein
MKKVFLIFLVLLVVSVGFSNLDVTYEQILRFIDIFIDMNSYPMDDGTPRSLGNYGSFSIEVVGPKDNPVETSVVYELGSDEEGYIDEEKK